MYKMNFNLDLLENINRYLFPLFYYSNEDSREYENYCPSTLKSVYFDLNFILFHDHLTKRSYIAEIWKIINILLLKNFLI